jgi:hypothetical protein
MEPIAALTERGDVLVVQRCTGCSHLWRNKISTADDWEAVLGLFGRAAPDPPALRPPASRPPTAGFSE